jgi:hypothetical protein
MKELCVDQPHPSTCLVDSSEMNLFVMGCFEVRNFRTTTSAGSLLAKIITVVEMLKLDIRDSNKTGLVLVILDLCLDTEATEDPVGLLV